MTRVPVSVHYLKFVWHLQTLGKKSTRVCRLCAGLMSPNTQVYLTTSTGTLSGIGPKDIICVRCAEAGTDGVKAVSGVDYVDV